MQLGFLDPKWFNGPNPLTTIHERGPTHIVQSQPSNSSS